MSQTNWTERKEFYIAYGIMINAAQHQGFSTYQEIAQAIGLPTAGSYMGTQVGGVVGAVSENERKLGRPMLSAVVVGTSGKPGSGFLAWAKQLGYLKEGEDEDAFWKNECKKVYEEWKITYRISRTKE